MSNLITIIDNKEDIIQLLSIYLKNSGFSFNNSSDIKKLLDSIDSEIPQLLILDLMLPDSNDSDMYEDLKNFDRLSAIPIVILGAKGKELARAIGCDQGTHNKISNSVFQNELSPKVRAVTNEDLLDKIPRKTVIGNILIIDYERREVSVNNRKIELTSTEFGILELLSSRKGCVFTREQILKNVWKKDRPVHTRTIDVHIRNLREKLEEASKFIKSIRGIGYKLVD